jgi:Xaa-Pro aminopeptidase
MSDAELPEPDVSADRPISEHWVWTGPHRPATPRRLVEHMTGQWAPGAAATDVHPAVTYTRSRRERLGATFEDRSLVVPTGNPKVRANDTDYRFRPGTDFFYLTASLDPDQVLVVAGGQSVLYVPRRRDASTHEFFTDARYGELWVGPRRGVEETALYLGLECRPLEELEKDLAQLSTAPMTVRGYDARIDALVPPSEDDEELERVLSEMRLVKDEFEIAELQRAIDDTVKGFADVVRALPSARARGERVIEGVFNLRARVEGNDVGYDTIAAAGPHATTLHWTANSGAVGPDDLLLLDAGVEGPNLYTADVTRTVPVSGTYSPAQRRVYELVLAAQEAALAQVRPGAAFLDPHQAAMRVLVDGLIELGIVAGPADEALRKDRQLHRRYTLHGVSHMLGLDVHDCAHARDEMYNSGELREGYVLTVEPGLYFQANDLTVPEEYRGIGVRIEDDVLVTTAEPKVLSQGIPSKLEDVEAAIARSRKALKTNPLP